MAEYQLGYTGAQIDNAIGNVLGSGVYFRTLLASGWAGSGPYTLSVTVAGTTSNDIPHVGPNYSSDLATRTAQKEAWNMVSFNDSVTDGVTFTCDDGTPSIDIPVIIQIIKVPQGV